MNIFRKMLGKSEAADVSSTEPTSAGGAEPAEDLSEPAPPPPQEVSVAIVVPRAPVVSESGIVLDAIASAAVVQAPLDADFTPTAASYRHPPFELGVRDGQDGVPPELNSTAIALTVDSTAARERRRDEFRMARLTEERTVVDLELGEAKREVTNADKLLADIRTRKALLQASRDEWRTDAVEFQKKAAKLLREKALEKHWGHKVLPLSGRPTHELQPRWANGLSGMLLLIGAVFMLVSDIAITSKTVEALGVGVPIPNEGDTADSFLFRLNQFGQAPAAYLLSWGLIAIALVIKWCYDKLSFGDYSRRHRRDWIVMSVVATLGVATLVSTGVVRWAFLRGTEVQSAGWKWEDWLGALMPLSFAVMGAVLLSEGLSKVFSAVKGRNHGQLIDDEGDLHKDEDALALLRMDLNEAEGQESASRERLERASAHARGLRSRLGRIDSDIASITARLEGSAAYWKTVSDLNLALYRHGYQYGSQYFHGTGAYRFVSMALLNRALPQVRDGGTHSPSSWGVQ